MINRIITTDLDHAKLAKIFAENDIFVIGQDRLGMHICVTSEHDSFAEIQHLVWQANPYAYCEVKTATVEDVEYYEN